MGKLRFINNFDDHVVGSFGPSATTLTINNAAPLGSLANGDFYFATLSDGVAFEVIKVTAIAGNNLTIVRGLEGTSGLSYTTGNPIQIRDTAGTLASFVQVSEASNLGKNRLINGAMLIWQRQTYSLTSNNYVADRWRLSGYLAGVSKQNSGIAGMPYAMRVDAQSAPASNHVNMSQAIESVNVYPLQGKTVTFSVYVRVGSGFTGGLALIGNQSNSSDAVSGGSNLFSVAATGVNTGWQRFEHTFSVPLDALGLEVGINHSGITTNADATDYFEMTGAQLEVGELATEFEYRPFGQEVALCQRYFEKSYDFGTDLGTATGFSGSGAWDYRYSGGAAGTMRQTIHFRTIKRALGTIGIWRPSNGTSGAWDSASGGLAAVGLTIYSKSSNGFSFEYSATGSETYISGHWACDSEL